jgi:hypothetical protein
MPERVESEKKKTIQLAVVSEQIPTDASLQRVLSLNQPSA